MSKAGDKAGSGASGAAGGEPSRATSSASEAGDAFPLHEHIGRQLKLLFEEVASEAVPERLRKLLEKLEREPPRETGQREQGPAEE